MTKRIAILGGGLSGLATAWYLKQHLGSRVHILLFEQQAELGGWIKTSQKEDFLFESGPRGFVPRGKGVTTLKLIEDLGLKNELVAASKCAKKRYLWLDNHLKLFSPRLLLEKGQWKGLLREFFSTPLPSSSYDVAEFIQKRFGEKLAQRVILPCLQGIFASQGHDLCLKSALPSLYFAEKTHGSLLKAFRKASGGASGPALLSFRKGMHTLPSALAQQIEGDVFLGTSIKKIHDRHTIETSSGMYEVDHVICALPSHLLKEIYFSAYQRLHPLAFTTLSLVHVGFRHLVNGKEGFGYLSPLNEESGYLGMTWDSQLFPEQNSTEQTRLTLMFRGKIEADEIQKMTTTILSEHLNIQQTPAYFSSQTLHSAMPHYERGHSERLRALEPLGISFVGNSYTGVGVNDCITEARRVAEKIVLSS